MGCYEVLKKAFPDMDDSEVKAMLADLEKKQGQLLRDAKNTDSLADGLDKYTEKVINELKRDAIVRKRQAIIDVLRKNERATNISKFDDPFKGIEASLVGTPGNLKFAQQSAEGLGKAIEAKIMGDMHIELEQGHAGIFKLFKSKKFDDDLGRELFELREGGTPGITKNADAQHAAGVFNKYKEILRKEANRAGADIRELDGHIIAQSHSSISLSKAGKEAWINKILPLLDQEKTFAGDDPKVFLENVYTSVTTGIRGLTEEPTGFKAKSSLAAVMGRKRELHFKDANSFIAYNAEFGETKSIVNGLDFGIRRMARNNGLLKMWGPNPEKNVKATIDKFASMTRKKDKPLTPHRQKALMHRYEAVSGQSKIPENPTLASIGANIRAVNTLAHLGGAMLSSFNDIATVAANANYHGIGFFSAYKQIFQNIATGKAKGAEKVIALDLLGDAFDGSLGSMAERFTTVDNVSGRMSKLVNTFFKLNRLQWWTDLHKEGSAMMLSRHLADSGDWDAMLPATQKGLLRYGITHSDWKILQQATTPMDNGKKYLVPSAIRDIPDEAFGKKTPAKLRDARDALENKLRMLFVTEADYSVVTPGARENAMFLHARPGTALGEAERFFWQFKAYPTNIITKVLPRLMEQGLPGIVPYMMMSLLFGYASAQTKDLFRGKGLKDPANAETWKQAAMMGGGLGIYGDFIFQDFNKFGGVWSKVAGPTFGMAEDAIKIFSSLKSLEGKRAGAQAARLAMDKMPFANLFYTKGALDYLLLYGIQESLNPGYLKRMERKMKKERGQEFLIRPSEYAVGAK